MALVRYPAWRELDEMTNRLARMFDDATVRRTNGAIFTPPVSVAETSDALIITAELPGLTEKEVTTVRGSENERRNEP